ncbi:hypothetical protein RhiTH_009610 [Rhizoctonia solani]
MASGEIWVCNVRNGTGAKRAAKYLEQISHLPLTVGGNKEAVEHYQALHANEQEYPSLLEPTNELIYTRTDKYVREELIPAGSNRKCGEIEYNDPDWVVKLRGLWEDAGTFMIKRQNLIPKLVKNIASTRQLYPSPLPGWLRTTTMSNLKLRD